MGQGRLIAVVGPSGVGKDTVMAALAASEPRLELVRRVITRAPEAGGEEYEPVSEAEFATRAAAGAFLLFWQAHGLSYGIPREVRDDLARGQDLLVNLSRGVLSEADRRVPGFRVLSLIARPEVLAARLAARGRESAEEIAARLARVANALPSRIQSDEIDNSGALETTLAAARAALYPKEVV